MNRLKTRSTISAAAAVLILFLVFAGIGTASAAEMPVALEIELPDTIAAGTTAEGSVWFVGGKGQNITTYSLSLESNAPSGEVLDLEVKTTPQPFGSNKAAPEVNANSITWFSTSGATLASDKELVFNFTVTVPSNPQKNTYIIGFNTSVDKVVYSTDKVIYAENDQKEAIPTVKPVIVEDVFSTAGAEKKISLTIELPEKAAPGETVTGEIYFIGGEGEVLDSLSLYRAVNHAAGESLNLKTLDEPLLAGMEEDDFISINPHLIWNAVQASDRVTLASDKELVCKFTIDIPANPAQHAYVVSFNDTTIFSTVTTAYSGLYPSPEAGHTVVPLTDVSDIVIIEEKELELFSYNGWTQTEKRETGKTYAASTNVTDVNTGTEVWTAKDVTLGHFNAVNKSQIVYKLGGTSVSDFKLTAAPVYYGYSAKNISLDYDGSGSAASIHKDSKVTVKYYSAAQDPVTDDALAEYTITWDSANTTIKLSEITSVPEDAAYSLIFFEGRPLGDVSGDLTVEAADITTMSSCFAGGFAKTDIDTFYGDVTSDGNYEAADLTCLSSYRAGGATEDYA